MKQQETQSLERGLKNRHVQLIAIGGAIGTGLFLGSGKSIHLTGPSILFTYLITGVMCFFLMRALGELLLSDLSYHSFVDFVQEFLGNGFAFVTGWTYWFCWICIAMADLTAVGIYVKYWWPEFPQWAPGLIALVILLCINLATVKIFGELEFWFALIKIIAIIGLIVVGAVVIVLGVKTTDGSQATISNLWSHGGFFTKGLEGFILSFQMGFFAFMGIELVGQTAGETENPEKVIPRAINSIPMRIIVFYILSLAVIMSIYPWDAVKPNESPFVKVFASVGILAAAGIVNFVVLTSAASAANSGVYSTSRMMYSLAKEGNAPASLGKVNHRHVPNRALFVSSLVIFVVVAMNYFLPDKVFDIVSSVATSSFIYIWGIMIVCHLIYRKRKPELAAQSKFKMPFAPYSDYLVLAFYVFIIFVLLYGEDTRLALLVTPVWFVLLIIIYQFKRRK